MEAEVPDLAASLRPTGRFGLAGACAGVGVVVALLAGSASAARQPTDPARLWSEFPLGEKRLDSPATTAARTPPSPAPRRAPVVRSSPSLDRPSRVRPILQAAFGVSALASALLFVLFVVTAVRSGFFYRRALIRQPPARTPTARTPEPSRNGRNPAITHLVFVPSEAGYSMVEADGEAPGVGTAIRGQFTVSKVGPSPLPADPRRCVYLEKL
jgi:hypothetical protein